MTINRIFNKNNDFSKIISNIIENQLEEKLNQLYNQQQADTVAQISEDERRVA